MGIGVPKKTAYLVCGPESTGTRFATSLLIKAGCTGESTHGQTFDHDLPYEQEQVVWRRSFPHGNKWPDLAEMISSLRERDYEVRALVTVRDWYSVIQSQVSVGHTADEAQAIRHVRYAYHIIFNDLNRFNVPFVTLSYEAMVSRPQPVISRMLEALGLPVFEMDDLEVKDGNAKYYDVV